MFFRVKKSGAYEYLQIAHSVRNGKSVRQHVISTLGRLDVLRDSGQLDKLLQSGARLCKSAAVISAHDDGDTEEVKVWKIGADLVFGRIWDECGIGKEINVVCSGRRHWFNLERMVYLTVLHRLFASGSDRAGHMHSGEKKNRYAPAWRHRHFYCRGHPLDRR